MRAFFTAGCLVAVALCAGCASVPLADPQADASGKRFAPAPNQAQVYVSRTSLVGAAMPMELALDGTPLGSLGYKTYQVVTVDPGPHRLSVRMQDRGGSTRDLVVAAGRNYYFTACFSMTAADGGIVCEPLTEEEGQARVASARRIEPSRAWEGATISMRAVAQRLQKNWPQLRSGLPLAATLALLEPDQTLINHMTICAADAVQTAHTTRSPSQVLLKNRYTIWRFDCVNNSATLQSRDYALTFEATDQLKLVKWAQTTAP